MDFMPFSRPHASAAANNAHLCIVDEVHESEAHFLFSASLVGSFVDDGGNSSHSLSVAERHKISGFAKVECRIEIRIECVYIILDERGNMIGIVAV